METFYKPYVSDESDLESDSDSDSYISEESLLDVPGKNPPISGGGPSKPFESNTLTTNTGTKFEEQAVTNSNLFMINSRDRDTNTYPQPTFFTLRLPRVFKNIKKINISQLNLLNSFFNFTASAGNTFMYVQEQGRQPVKVQIRDGTYSSGDLVTELTSALNSTPLFADITLGDFISGFQSTGNFTPLFNTPGTVVYNSLTQTYQANQTMNDIISRYFRITEVVGTVTYSYNQALVAYYYPVMKEMIITGVPFDTSSVFATQTEAYTYLVFYFTGLDDANVLAIASNLENQALFNTYRFQNTFNLSLVNEYVCSYNAKQGRLVINVPSLNASISSDLNTQYNSLLTSLVLSNSQFTDVNDFNNQYASITNQNTSLISFYNFIQSRFSSNFGINFGTYAAEFYANSNNEIILYNTLNRYGWFPSLTPGVSASTIMSNSPSPQVSTFLSNIILPYSVVNQQSFISSYEIQGNINFSSAGENTLGYFDIPFTVKPTTYERITFNSQYRQNISLMTIPRYINNRSTTNDVIYNMGYLSSQTPLLYDYRDYGSTFYNRVDISGNILFNLYEVNQNMFNTVFYMRTENKWITYLKSQILSGQRIQLENPNYGRSPPVSDVTITSFRPFIFFQVNAAAYLSEPKAHFNISFYVETQDGTPFSVPLVIVWYKDRAAFMSDVQLDLNGDIGIENPQNYFKRQVFSGTNSAQMVVDVNNYQETYFHVHIEQGSAVPSSLPLRVFSLLTDTYGTYTIATRTDYFNMPFILGSLEEQDTPANAKYQDPNKSIYNPSTIQLGYDISGVSNNLLDYTINAGNRNYYDPTTISDYISFSKTGLEYQFVLSNSGAPQPAPDITTWSLFFGSNSSNRILDTYNTNNNVYLSTLQVPKPLQTGLKNEFTLVNWFAPGNSNNPEVYYSPPNTNLYEYIGPSSIFLPCVNVPSLITDVSTPTTFQDISGFSGLSFFLPPNQVVRLDTLVLKFIYTQPSIDTTERTYTRSYSPLALTGLQNTNAVYRNQTTHTNVSTFVSSTTVLTNYDDWDDFYLLNRQNIKIGLFETAKIEGLHTSSINLSNALMSLTLSQITQVNNYQYGLGTFRTREPDWGTYYKYSFSDRQQNLWDVATIPYNSSISSFRQTRVDADFAPSYIAGASTYTNYFLTNPNIINYTYLPRSYGIAPSVANALQNPFTISSILSDIPHSYTFVPFSFDATTSTYQVGCFHGLSFTFQPGLPSTNLTGASPYYGPMGPFGWELNQDNLLTRIQREASTLGAYYWNAKLNYNAIDLQYDPATDLSAFGGYTGISGEVQDTFLFLYENPKSTDDDIRDVSTIDAWVWGQEKNTNYLKFDNNSGYNNLSYINNFTVRNTKSYAAHIRGYDPIPEFTTGLRFIGKNYTDFGSLTLTELTQEISSLAGYVPITDAQGSYFNAELLNKSTLLYNITIANNTDKLLSNGVSQYSHTYADALINFDRTFSTTQTFGKTNTFPGLTYTFTGFNEAINQYISLFSTTTATLVTYNNILSTATGELGSYVVTRYGNILPSSIVTRNRTTDPLPFSLLFSSYTLPPYQSLYDAWGLGYNIGFNKADTPIRTTATSDTFIRIVQSYIYLRLNPELNINSMAVSGKENLADCRESAGQERKAFAKIILNDFGSFSSTAVQRPKEFNPVLGKYEVITCQLVDKYGEQLSSLDCEYDFVLQIDELSNGPKDSSSLLGPTSDLDVYKTRM